MIFASIFPAFYIGWHRCDSLRASVGTSMTSSPSDSSAWVQPEIHPENHRLFTKKWWEKRIKQDFITKNDWLVVDLRLWKMMDLKSVGMIFHSQYMESHKNPWFQTTKQIWISSPNMMILLGGNGDFWQPFRCWFNHQKIGIWATQWWYFMKDINGNITRRCINHDERDLIDGFNPSEKYARHWGSSCQSYEWTNTLKPLSNKHMDGISPKKSLKPAVTWWYSHHTPPGLGHLGGLEANSWTFLDDLRKVFV